MGNPEFLGVALESPLRGNAMLIKVENESMTIRLVPGSGNEEVGCVRRAIRWDRVGVEK